MAVRTIKFEVRRIRGAETSERFAAWMELAKDCQAASNEYYKRWELWHYNNNSAEALAKWQGELRAYRRQQDALRSYAKWKSELKSFERGKGKRPGECPVSVADIELFESENMERRLLQKPAKCPVECFTGFEDACNPSVYKQIASKFPRLGTNTVTQLLGAIRQKMSSTPAAQGSFYYWQSVVLDQERRPCHTNPVPVPFPKDRCRLPESVDDGKCVVGLYIERAGEGEAIWDNIEIVTKGRGMGSRLAILRRMIEEPDQWPMKGSTIQYNEKKKKWFLALCYERPKVNVDVDPANVAVLRAGIERPWILEIGERQIFVAGGGRDIEQKRRGFIAQGLSRAGGDEPDVGGKRRHFLRQKLGRSQNYRNAGSSNKGHGRERAMAPQNILSRGWKDFVKTFNHVVTKRVIDICVQENIGTLVYRQPVESERDHLFLARAGKIPGYNDSTGWDWYQVQAQLNYKAAEYGIIVTNERSGKPLKPKKERKRLGRKKKGGGDGESVS